MISEICKCVGRMMKIYAGLAAWTILIADTFTICIIGLINISKGV